MSASRGGTRMTQNTVRYVYYWDKRCNFLAQYVYSNDITTTAVVRRGSGSWCLAEGQTPQFLASQYQPNLRLASTVCVQYQQYYDYYHSTRR